MRFTALLFLLAAQASLALPAFAGTMVKPVLKPVVKKKTHYKPVIGAPLPPPMAPSEPLFKFEPNTAVWASGTYRDVLTNDYNPGNVFAHTPYDTETFEIRPDWRFSGKSWKLTFRPRPLVTREDTKVLGQTTSRTLALLRWSSKTSSGAPPKA
jgi:hypothetical protein